MNSIKCYTVPKNINAALNETDEWPFNCSNSNWFPVAGEQGPDASSGNYLR